MRLLSNGLKGWKKSWKDDLRASVSVAFIAIPLGLGIALASGVPPIAGVIPCVIGGLILAWFSGGNIAVHSTPKMLIGVTAAAIITLGGDDPLLGYRLFLSVVVVAGLVQFVLGLLRLGVIGELIPATVVKSLLSRQHPRRRRRQHRRPHRRPRRRRHRRPRPRERRRRASWTHSRAK